MAGGTGGHVFPALAVASALQEKGVAVTWIGVKQSLEQRLANQSGMEFESISIRGFWGKGLLNWLTLPVWMMISVLQCIRIILSRRPDALLGMGGYVCAPGGLAGWLMRRPLLIHESNTIAGLTNRVLARLSDRVLLGFPVTEIAGNSVVVGNPVRTSVLQAARKKPSFNPHAERKIRLLVIGGSQGAQSLNELLPRVIASINTDLQPEILHQAGAERGNAVSKDYDERQIAADVREFIDDMAEVYAWADIAVARAGAMTIAELSTMGIAPILIPLPHAARDHQKVNAQQLVDQQCALMIEEGDGLISKLRDALSSLLSDRHRILEMSQKIKQFSTVQATDLIVQNCLELMEA